MPLTTKHEVRERIRNFVLDACVEYCNDYDDCDSSTPEGALLKVYESFREEASHYINRLGEYNGFIEWLQGVTMPIPFEYYEERKTVAEWLDETPEESEKYDDEKMDKLYWNLFTREFFALCRKYKIENKYNMKKAEQTGVNSCTIASVYTPSDIEREFKTLI